MTGGLPGYSFSEKQMLNSSKRSISVFLKIVTIGPKFVSRKRVKLILLKPMANAKALFTALLIVVTIASCSEEERLIPPVELIFPATESSDQPLDVTLEWQNSSSENSLTNTLVYDVYLGESPSQLELMSSDLAESRYECKALDLNTEYFWKVRIKASGQVQDSQVRSFTTTNELPFFEFQSSRIMVYPADYRYEYPDSLVVLITLRFADAFSWQDGSENTQALLTYYQGQPREELGIAAKYCDDLQAYGFTDWYLPSIVEIDSAVSKFDLLKSSGEVYWSSTEYEKRPHLVYTKSSLTYPGEPYSIDQKAGGEYDDFKCRCVRRE